MMDRRHGGRLTSPRNGRRRPAASLLAALALFLHALGPLAHGAAMARSFGALAIDLANHCAAGENPVPPTTPRHEGERSDCGQCICPIGPAAGAMLAADDSGISFLLPGRRLAPFRTASQQAPRDDGHSPHRPRAPPSLV